LPSKSFGKFILEETELENKIKEIQKEISKKQISDTEEGIVLQMVDRESNIIIDLVKIKCVEY
jgi:hypothetical protein